MLWLLEEITKAVSVEWMLRQWVWLGALRGKLKNEIYGGQLHLYM